MKKLLLLVLLLYGCATTAPPESDLQLPELVSQVPLPAPTRLLQGRPLKLELKIHVADDGSVREASFMSSSGDHEWDRLALEKVRQWRFSPALHGGKPVSIWIRQSIVLQFSDQLIMSLAEIRCTQSWRADSVYAALQAGAEFAELARRFSEASSAHTGGLVGEVDIRSYPQLIQEELKDLKPGEFTAPIRVGAMYVILRRMPDGK